MTLDKPPIETIQAIARVEVRTQWERVGQVIGDCFARLFSDARSFAWMKLPALTAVLMLIGVGGVFRAYGPGNGGERPFITIELSSPTTAQIIGGVVAFAFFLMTNLYFRRFRARCEVQLIRIAADPATHPEARKQILERLRRS
jgi:hypothetical protein